MEAEVTYLDALADELSQMDLKVNTSEETSKQKEQQEKSVAEDTAKKHEFQCALAALRAKLEGFGKPSINLEDLSREKKISFADMRLELSKLEGSQASLLEERVRVSNMDPSADISAVCDLFTNMVVLEVE